MKTILVITDYSQPAKNAGLYAAALAKQFKAKLILFHVFNLPMVSSDVPFPALTAKELEKENKEMLKKEASALKKKYNVNVEVKTAAGLAVSEILELEKKLKPDLIVAGMKGKSNAARILIGSTVTDLIRKTNTPVLVIPEKKKFHVPEKILLACDYVAPILPGTIASAKEFAKKFGSEIYVVNVVSNSQAAPERAKAGVELEKELGNLNYVYYFPHKKDVIKGMDYFLHRHKTDLIAMIPHKHNLFERMFGKSITRRMVFHTRVPLLALPEKHKRIPAYLI